MSGSASVPALLTGIAALALTVAQAASLAAQISPAGDIPKRTMLAAQGLTLATNWYVKPLLPEEK